MHTKLLIEMFCFVPFSQLVKDVNSETETCYVISERLFLKMIVSQNSIKIEMVVGCEMSKSFSG